MLSLSIYNRFFIVVVVILDLVFRFVAVVVISSLFCFIAVVVANPDTGLFNSVIFVSVQFLNRIHTSCLLYLSIQILTLCIIGAVSLSSTWFIVSLMLFFCLPNFILIDSLISVNSIGQYKWNLVLKVNIHLNKIWLHRH